MTGKFLLVAMLILTLALPASAQKKIEIQAGISLFPDPRLAPEVFVEFPFSVKRDAFQFMSKDSVSGEMIAGIYADIILTDTLGTPLDTNSTYFLTRAMGEAEAAEKNVSLFNRLGLMIKPGMYKAKLTVIDAVSKNESVFSYDMIEIVPPPYDRLNISSLELSHEIIAVSDEEAGAENPLVKNGRMVRPNPMGIYIDGDSLLYLYAEIYNLNYNTAREDSFVTQFKMLDERKILKDDFGTVSLAMPGSTAVVSNVLSIKNYMPGKYFVDLYVTDLSNGAIDSARNVFYIFPKQGVLPQVTEYKIRHPYDTSSLITKMQLSKFLLEPTEAEMLSTLTDAGKARFIDQFFRDKDPDPTTQVNEYLDKIFNYYVFANKNFSAMVGGSDGWKSDRGRVLLQYGQWDERFENYMPSSGNPWEIWDYHSLQGGVIFAFEDITGYGDYKLVHSTARGEIYSQEKQEELESGSPVNFDFYEDK